MNVTAGDTGDSARALLRRAVRAMRAAGIPDAPMDARLLLCHASGLSREDLLRDPTQPVVASAAGDFETLVERRLRREPVSHLLCRREFWGLEFEVSAAVLDPRPDSETLIEAALEMLPERDAPINILDLGTGSGCLLLALMSEFPSARGLGVDISPAALSVARANAQALGMADRASFRHADWGREIDAKFDLVVANPPYIAAPEIAYLAPEIRRHEPRLALDGGPDGLRAYREIANIINDLLAPNGLFVVECGARQAADVRALLEHANLRIRGIRADLGGLPRALIAEAVMAASLQDHKKVVGNRRLGR